MTNPQMYVPVDVTLRSVYPEPGSETGYAVLVDQLPRIIGFQLRNAASLFVADVDGAKSGMSSTAIAIALTKAQAFTDLADELDPEHRTDSAALWARGGEV